MAEFNEHEFDDIRPFNDEELLPALGRIIQDEWLIDSLTRMRFARCPRWLKPLVHGLIHYELWRRLSRIKSVDEFQRDIIVNRVLAYILRKTSDGVSVSGTEKLRRGSPYLYISNHRDIVLDSAILNHALCKAELDIAEIAFGENLLINDFVADLIRVNRSFIVRRDVPMRQRVQVATHLSRYIEYTLGLNNSVWIAQRDGRAKDGDDRTNPSLIKMLYLSRKQRNVPLDEFLEALNIIPVALSYERDPCDVLKAREVHRTQTTGEYRKRRDEDLLSMYTGLRGDKGRIHIAFGERVTGKHRALRDVANAIDNEIHRIYRLWPSNYVAYDLLHSGTKYAGCYSPAEAQEFAARFEREHEGVRRCAYTMYANVILNKERIERASA